MKRVKSELFKYSNISTDHLSLFAWSHAFIYEPFTCFVYMFIPICTILPQAQMPPTTLVTHHQHQCPPPPLSPAAPTPTMSQTKWAQMMLDVIVWAQVNNFAIVFESPVYWTEKRPWTEPNRTDGNWTISCSCPNIFTSLVHGSSMIWHLNRLPKDWPQPVVDWTLVASSLQGVNKC